MSGFTVHLQSASSMETIENVLSFTGADRSGSFGIMAGHERMMSILDFGLARLRIAHDRLIYIALPGGILYFTDNQLFISTRRYISGDDIHTVETAIGEILTAEEEAMHDLKGSIARLEQEMTRRLWRLQHGKEKHYA